MAGGAQHIWLKLRWEANRLREAHHATPIDVISLIYSAINFAVTAQSLEEWVIQALKKRAKRSRFDAIATRDAVAAAIPMQPAFRDIANTAKHGHYRDENWLGGTVELVHMPGFAGTPREYVLIYHGREGNSRTSLDIFEQATDQWLQYLKGVGLVNISSPSS